MVRPQGEQPGEEVPLCPTTITATPTMRTVSAPTAFADTDTPASPIRADGRPSTVARSGTPGTCLARPAGPRTCSPQRIERRGISVTDAPTRRKGSGGTGPDLPSEGHEISRQRLRTRSPRAPGTRRQTKEPLKERCTGGGGGLRGSPPPPPSPQGGGDERWRKSKGRPLPCPSPLRRPP